MEFYEDNTVSNNEEKKLPGFECEERAFLAGTKANKLWYA